MPPSPDLITQSVSSHLLMSQWPPTLAQTAAAGLATSISILIVVYCGSAARARPAHARLPSSARIITRRIFAPFGVRTCLAVMADFLGPGDLRVLVVLALERLFPRRFRSRFRLVRRAQRET